MPLQTTPRRCCSPQSQKRVRGLALFFKNFSKRVRTSSNKSCKTAKRKFTKSIATHCSKEHVEKEKVTSVRLVNLESEIKDIGTHLCNISKALCEKPAQKKSLCIEEPCLYNTQVQTSSPSVAIKKDESCESFSQTVVTCKPCSRKKHLNQPRNASGDEPHSKSCCRGCPKVKHIINSTKHNNSSESASNDDSIKCRPKGRIQLSSMSVPLCQDDDSLDETNLHVRKCIKEFRECEPKRHNPKDKWHCCSRDKNVYSYVHQDYGFPRKIIDYETEPYDLIPVKQKWSPKSRKKFVEHRQFAYQVPKDIPPSPVTLRPQLNLKPQKQNYNRRDHTSTKTKSRMSSTALQSIYLREYDKSPENIAYNVASRGCLESSTSKGPMLRKRTHKEEEISGKDPRNEFKIVRGPIYNVRTSSTETRSRREVPDTQNTQIDTHEKILADVKDILLFLVSELHNDTSATSEPKCYQENINTTATENRRNVHDKQNGSSTCSSQDIHKCRLAQFFNPYCYFLLPMYPTQDIKKLLMSQEPCFRCHEHYKTKTKKCEKDMDNSNNNVLTVEAREEIEKLVKSLCSEHKTNKENSISSCTKQIERIGANRNSRRRNRCNNKPFTKCTLKKRYSKSCEDFRTNFSYSASSFNGYTDTMLDLITWRSRTPIHEGSTSIPDSKVNEQNLELTQTPFMQDVQQYSFYGADYFGQFDQLLSQRGLALEEAQCKCSNPMPQLKENYQRYSKLIQLLASEAPDQANKINKKPEKVEIKPTAPPEEIISQQNSMRFYIKQIEVRNASTQYEVKISCLRRFFRKIFKGNKNK